MVNADPIASQIAITNVNWIIRFRWASPSGHACPWYFDNSEQHYLSIESVAERLHMSDRNLKRQLAALYLFFYALVDEGASRHTNFSAVLRTDYSLEQIADELGYSRQWQTLTITFKRYELAIAQTTGKTIICNIIAKSSFTILWFDQNLYKAEQKWWNSYLRSCHEPSSRFEICAYAWMGKIEGATLLLRGLVTMHGMSWAI